MLQYHLLCDKISKKYFINVKEYKYLKHVLGGIMWVLRETNYFGLHHVSLPMFHCMDKIFTSK